MKPPASCSRCRDPPTAIFASSDAAAFGVLGAARDAGLAGAPRPVGARLRRHRRGLLPGSRAVDGAPAPAGDGPRRGAAPHEPAGRADPAGGPTGHGHRARHPPDDRAADQAGPRGDRGDALRPGPARPLRGHRSGRSGPVRLVRRAHGPLRLRRPLRTGTPIRRRGRFPGRRPRAGPRAGRVRRALPGRQLRLRAIAGRMASARWPSGRLASTWPGTAASRTPSASTSSCAGHARPASSP